MAQTLEYVLITAATADVLSREVTQRLNDGWQLYGNPTVGGAAVPHYAQALVRDVGRPMKIGPV